MVSARAMIELLKNFCSRITTRYRAIVDRKRDGACKAAKDRIRSIRKTMDFFDKRRVHVFLYDDVLRVVADTLADVIRCRCRQTQGCCGYLSQREIAELEQLIPTIKSKFLKVAGFLLDHRRISLLRYWVKTKYTDMYLGKKAIEQKDFEVIMGKAFASKRDGEVLLSQLATKFERDQKQWFIPFIDVNAPEVLRLNDAGIMERVFPWYGDEEVIAGGSTSKVYAIAFLPGQVNLPPGRKVAAKVVSTSPGTIGKDVFDQELKALMHLEPHPNIPRVYGAIETSRHGIILMERGETTLLSLVEQENNPVTYDALTVACHMLAGLAHIKRCDEILHHLDLKMENILRASDGRYLIIDFGCSQSESRDDVSLSSVGSSITSHNAPPPDDNNTKNDEWFSGTILLEVLVRQELGFKALEAFRKSIVDYGIVEKSSFYHGTDHGPELKPQVTDVLYQLQEHFINDSDHLPRLPDYLTLLQMIKLALSVDPETRPSAVELSAMLETIRTNPSSEDEGCTPFVDRVGIGT